jgi:2-iminobutanoate/2-iminopropanoate deaminase
VQNSSLYTANAPQPIGPYSQATLAGGFLFTSGQLGVDPATGQLLNTTFEEEAAQVLKNLKHVLAAGNLDFADVVSTTIFITDLSFFKTLNTFYEKALAGHKPARTTVQVAALPLGARIEISMVAFQG